jgi:hypothetical protein
MGKGFEHSVFTSASDKTNDAQTLSADTWSAYERDARGSLASNAGLDDGATVWNLAKAVPQTFAAFAGLRNAPTSEMSSMGRVGLGLGALYAGEYAIDKLFFKDQNIRGGSMAFDFVAPAAIMMTPFAMKYKVGASLLSHVAGKLMDKYGS